MNNKPNSHWMVAAGTTESLAAVRFLLKYNRRISICVATGFGGGMFKELIADSKNQLNLSIGRKDVNAFTAFMTEHYITHVLDTTHPFAVEVSRQLKEACDNCGIVYYRYTRPEETYETFSDVIHLAADSGEAAVLADKLAGKDGNIFLTTGVNTLEIYAKYIPDFQRRCYARVLDVSTSKEKCRRLFLNESHFCTGMPPFDREDNEALIRLFHAKVLVSKDSGKNGGVAAKLEAVKAAGIRAVLIKRPKEPGQLTSLEELNMEERDGIF